MAVAGDVLLDTFLRSIAPVGEAFQALTLFGEGFLDRFHQGIDAGTGGVDPLELVCGVPGGREGLRAKVRHHHDIGARQGVAKGWLVTGKAHIGAGPDCVHSRRFLLSRRGENGNNRFAVLSH